MTTGRSEVEQAVLRSSHLRQLDRLDDAEQVVRTALASQPHDATLLAELASVLLRANRYTEGLQVSSALIAAAPDSERGHRLYALMLSYLDRHAEAMPAAFVAVQLNPNEPLVALCYAIVLKRAGRLVEAEQTARKAIELDPSSADSHFQLADVLSERGQWDGARAAYLETLRLQPGHATARHDLAVLDVNTHRLTPALRGLIDAGALDPKLSQVLRNVRTLLWQLAWRLRIGLLIVTFTTMLICAAGPPGLARTAATVVLLLGVAAGWWYVRRLPGQTATVAKEALRGDLPLALTGFSLAVCTALYLVVLVTGSVRYLVLVYPVLIGLGVFAAVVGAIRRNKR